WELSRSPSTWLAAAFWVLLGLATLTKGPVGLALVACAGLASWWWGGPVSSWGRLRWRWGVPLFVLVTAPWYVAVGVSSRGEFFRFGLGRPVAERVLSGVEADGGVSRRFGLTLLPGLHPPSPPPPAPGRPAP